jgi:hypothetical protein
VVLGAAVIELVVDLAGDPEQRGLPQCGEVADPEVVAERGVSTPSPARVAAAVRTLP